MTNHVVGVAGITELVSGIALAVVGSTDVVGLEATVAAVTRAHAVTVRDITLVLP